MNFARRRWAIAAILGVYGATLAITRPETYSDTTTYAGNILAYQDHRLPLGLNPFWDFGHLIWRPLAWLLWRLFQPLIHNGFDGDRTLQVAAVMVGLSCAAGAIVVVFAILLAARAGATTWEACAVATVLLFSNPVLNYTQTGMAYIPGLACQIGALYLLIGKLDAPFPARARPVAAGCFLGLSIGFWFPYALTIPGVLAAAYFWRNGEFGPLDVEKKRRLFRLAAAAATCIAVTVALYAAVMIPNGIVTAVKAREWAASAGHGWSQNRKLIRAITGVPRSMFNLGEDGLMLKRFLFHDPYAPVSAADLFRLSLWKLLLFYASLASLAFLLWQRGRGILAALALTAAPVLFFAIVLFEPSSPERFLPVFGVLFPALAIAFCRYSPRRLSQDVLALLFVAVVATGLEAYGPSGREKFAPAAERLSTLRAIVRPDDLVALLSFRDDLYVFLERFPFDPSARTNAPRIYDVIEAGTERTVSWRSEFSTRALTAWRKGGIVWISRRLLSARPRPDWNWAEKEDPRVSWADVVQFFRRLDVSSPVGGNDGFHQLLDSAKNRQLLGAR